jgi:hypothetical protein
MLYDALSRRRQKMNSIKVLSILMLLAVAPGCILMDEHHHSGCVGSECTVRTGEMLFYWAFELADGTVTDQCDVAEIAAVDITIYNGYGDLEFSAIEAPSSTTSCSTPTPSSCRPCAPPGVSPTRASGRSISTKAQTTSGPSPSGMTARACRPGQEAGDRFLARSVQAWYHVSCNMWRKG